MSVEDLWAQKTDTELAAAAATLHDYTEYVRQIIQAELRKRGLAEPPQTPRPATTHAADGFAAADYPRRPKGVTVVACLQLMFAVHDLLALATLIFVGRATLPGSSGTIVNVPGHLFIAAFIVLISINVVAGLGLLSLYPLARYVSIVTNLVEVLGRAASYVALWKLGNLWGAEPMWLVVVDMILGLGGRGWATSYLLARRAPFATQSSGMLPASRFLLRVACVMFVLIGFLNVVHAEWEKSIYVERIHARLPADRQPDALTTTSVDAMANEFLPVLCALLALIAMFGRRWAAITLAVICAITVVIWLQLLPSASFEPAVRNHFWNNVMLHAMPRLLAGAVLVAAALASLDTMMHTEPGSSGPGGNSRA